MPHPANKALTMHVFHQKNRKISRWYALYVIPLLLLIWQLAAMISDSNLILPTPFSVLRAFFALAKTDLFWSAALFSLARVLLGFFIGGAVGILFALLAHLFRYSEPFFHAVIVITKSTPVVSFIIIAWFYLETEALPTFIAALMVIPIYYTNTKAGLSSVDLHLREVAWLYDLKPLQKLRLLWLPSLLPHLTSATLTGCGLAWKAGIAAEVIVQVNRSLGREMFFSKSYLEIENLFAYTITVILLSLGIEYLLRFLLKKEGSDAKN